MKSRSKPRSKEVVKRRPKKQAPPPREAPAQVKALSLPPALSGPTFGYMTVEINKVRWRQADKSPLVRIIWWGEPKTSRGQLFSCDDSHASIPKVRKIPITSDYDGFTRYMTDMKIIVFDIVEAEGHDIIGNCSVGTSLFKCSKKITPFMSLEGEFPIVAKGTEGSLRIIGQMGVSLKAQWDGKEQTIDTVSLRMPTDTPKPYQPSVKPEPLPEKLCESFSPPTKQGDKGEKGYHPSSVFFTGPLRWSDEIGQESPEIPYTKPKEQKDQNVVEMGHHFVSPEPAPVPVQTGTVAVQPVAQSNVGLNQLMDRAKSLRDEISAEISATSRDILNLESDKLPRRDPNEDKPNAKKRLSLDNLFLMNSLEEVGGEGMGFEGFGNATAGEIVDRILGQDQRTISAYKPTEEPSTEIVTSPVEHIDEEHEKKHRVLYISKIGGLRPFDSRFYIVIRMTGSPPITFWAASGFIFEQCLELYSHDQLALELWRSGQDNELIGLTFIPTLPFSVKPFPLIDVVKGVPTAYVDLEVVSLSDAKDFVKQVAATRRVHVIYDQQQKPEIAVPKKEVVDEQLKELEQKIEEHQKKISEPILSPKETKKSPSLVERMIPARLCVKIAIKGAKDLPMINGEPPNAYVVTSLCPPTDLLKRSGLNETIPDYSKNKHIPKAFIKPVSSGAVARDCNPQWNHIEHRRAVVNSSLIDFLQKNFAFVSVWHWPSSLTGYPLDTESSDCSLLGYSLISLCDLVGSPRRVSGWVGLKTANGEEGLINVEFSLVAKPPKPQTQVIEHPRIKSAQPKPLLEPVRSDVPIRVAPEDKHLMNLVVFCNCLEISDFQKFGNFWFLSIGEVCSYFNRQICGPGSLRSPSYSLPRKCGEQRIDWETRQPVTAAHLRGGHSVKIFLLTSMNDSGTNAVLGSATLALESLTKPGDWTAGEFPIGDFATLKCRIEIEDRMTVNSLRSSIGRIKGQLTQLVGPAAVEEEEEEDGDVQRIIVVVERGADLRLASGLTTTDKTTALNTFVVFETPGDQTKRIVSTPIVVPSVSDHPSIVTTYLFDHIESLKVPKLENWIRSYPLRLHLWHRPLFSRRAGESVIPIAIDDADQLIGSTSIDLSPLLLPERREELVGWYHVVNETQPEVDCGQIFLSLRLSPPLMSPHEQLRTIALPEPREPTPPPSPRPRTETVMPILSMLPLPPIDDDSELPSIMEIASSLQETTESIRHLFSRFEEVEADSPPSGPVATSTESIARKIFPDWKGFENELEEG